jgi:hypothetical protein
MKTTWLLMLLSIVLAAGCASGLPASTDSRSAEQAACEGRGGGFWIAAAGQCARGGGGP